MLNRGVFLEELEKLVNIDSGTYCKEGVNQVQDWFAARFARPGWEIEWFDPAPDKLGRSFLAWPGGEKTFDLLILCHADTVFPAGEVARRPFTAEGDRLRGPGVADMKSGCLFTLHAIEQLLAEKAELGRIGVFFNGEHEISCPNTRPIIEALSAASRIVFSSEPTRANGSHIRQRKGILRYTVKFTGVSAHAGNNPEQGVCAVTELANWVLFFKSLEDQAKGITVNPGMISGGTSVNTIPDSAELRVDIRTVTQEDSLRIDEEVRRKTSFNPKATFTVEGGITRPPMKPNQYTDRLCALVEEAGARHGVNVTWTFAGGGSDASFASGMGRPSLCGLGPVGGGMHTEKEFLDTRDLEARFEEYKDVIRAFSNERL